jgi:hypothetical protein
VPNNRAASLFACRPILLLLDPGWVMTGYGGSLQLSKPKMQDFVNQHARQIASLNTAISGHIRIYEISW